MDARRADARDARRNLDARGLVLERNPVAPGESLVAPVDARNLEDARRNPDLRTPVASPERNPVAQGKGLAVPVDARNLEDARRNPDPRNPVASPERNPVAQGKGLVNPVVMDARRVVARDAVRSEDARVQRPRSEWLL
jgi:hypothetical protein